jgi:hypothetical protein
MTFLLAAAAVHRRHRMRAVEEGKRLARDLCFASMIARFAECIKERIVTVQEGFAEVMGANAALASGEQPRGSQGQLWSGKCSGEFNAGSGG